MTPQAFPYGICEFVNFKFRKYTVPVGNHGINAIFEFVEEDTDAGMRRHERYVIHVEQLSFDKGRGERAP